MDKKHTHAKINTVIRIFILLPFWFLSTKLQKIMIQAKEYPEKITRLQIPTYFYEGLFWLSIHFSEGVCFLKDKTFFTLHPSPKRRILLYNSHLRGWRVHSTLHHPSPTFHLNKILSRPEERLIDSWNRNKAQVNFNQATRKLYLRLKPTQKEA